MGANWPKTVPFQSSSSQRSGPTRICRGSPGERTEAGIQVGKALPCHKMGKASLSVDEGQVGVDAQGNVEGFYVRFVFLQLN